MARPRTPTALLIARGNPHAKRRRRAEPKDPIGAPTMPPGLPKGAQEHWRWIVPKLLERGTLAIIELGLLAAMCCEWAEYIEAVRDIEKLKRSGKSYKGHLIDHPRVRLKGSFERYSRAALQFGLSPASKSRVQPIEKPATPELKPAGPVLRIAQ